MLRLRRFCVLLIKIGDGLVGYDFCDTVKLIRLAIRSTVRFTSRNTVRVNSRRGYLMLAGAGV